MFLLRPNEPEARPMPDAAPHPQPRHVAIVGNAPGTSGWAERIDAADWVVRFNNAPGFGGVTGRRATHLALVNHGGQMAEWLADSSFTERAVLRAAQTILFPFERRADPGTGDARDWTVEATRRLAPLGKAVETIGASVREEAERIVAGPKGRKAPSTGLLATLHMLHSLPQGVRIDVYGFGFEGWTGHAFGRERRWFEASGRAGRLRLHPLCRDAADAA